MLALEWLFILDVASEARADQVLRSFSDAVGHELTIVQRGWGMDKPTQFEARTQMVLTSEDLSTAMAEVMRLAAPVSDQWIVTALDATLRGSIVWQGRALQCRILGVREVTFVLLDPAATDKDSHRLSRDDPKPSP